VSDYDYDEDGNENGPKALREHAKKLEKQLADLQKRFDEEQAARAAAEKAAKSQSLNSILRDKGVKPGLARWLEKDGVEATAEAVGAWLKENGEFFNVKATEPVEKATNEDEPAGEPSVSPETEAAIRASQGLDASGVSPSEVDVMQKLQSIDVSKFNSPEELQAAIAATGLQFD
jgi:hypothetical protein